MTFNNQGIFGFDISTWQDAPTTPAVVDFQKMKNYGASFCIIRAGQGNFIDQDWNTHIQNSLGVIPVEAYWFYDPRYSPTVQANTCLQALSGTGIKRLWIDLEFTWSGDYAVSTYWKDFRERIKTGGYKTGIYTRKTWWDDKVGLVLSAYFAQDPLWVAQYNDALTLIPKGWTTAMIWQDGTPSVGHAAGVESEEIDHNLWNSDFYFEAEWGVTAPEPVVDVVTTPFVGMTHISGERHGWVFHLFITDPALVDYEVVCCNPLETPSQVARRKGATLATNGGEWDRISAPKDYTVSNGHVCKARVEPVPSLLVGEENQIAIDHRPYAMTAQTLSGLRYLIQNGHIKDYLNNNEPQYTEGHARSIHGVTAQGQHIVMQSQGVYPNQGLTLKQAAEIMKQYGAVTAFDSGGGGDVACILDGQSLIIPENIYEGVHFERALPSVFLIYANGGTMNGLAKEALGNIPVVRRTPSRYGDEVTRLSAYVQVEFTEKVPVVPEGPNDRAGEMWIKRAVDGNYVNQKLYVNNILKDVFTILQEPTIEPPPPDDEGMKVNYACQETFPQEGRMRWSVRRNNGTTEFIDYPI